MNLFLGHFNHLLLLGAFASVKHKHRPKSPDGGAGPTIKQKHKLPSQALPVDCKRLVLPAALPAPPEQDRSPPSRAACPLAVDLGGDREQKTEQLVRRGAESAHTPGKTQLLLSAVGVQQRPDQKLKPVGSWPVKEQPIASPGANHVAPRVRVDWGTGCPGRFQPWRRQRPPNAGLRNRTAWGQGKSRTVQGHLAAPFEATPLHARLSSQFLFNGVNLMPPSHQGQRRLSALPRHCSRPALHPALGACSPLHGSTCSHFSLCKWLPMRSWSLGS